MTRDYQSYRISPDSLPDGSHAHSCRTSDTACQLAVTDSLSARNAQQFAPHLALEFRPDQTDTLGNRAVVAFGRDGFAERRFAETAFHVGDRAFARIETQAEVAQSVLAPRFECFGIRRRDEGILYRLVEPVSVYCGYLH